MREKIRSFFPELKNAVSIGGGTLLGQVILVAATPLLSRLYSPEAFGIFSAIVAITSIIGPSAALRFDLGIVLPKEEEKAGALARLALISSAVVSLGSALVIWGFGAVSTRFHWDGVVFTPLWIAALIFLTSLFTTLTQIALRLQEYSQVARRSPIQSIATAVGQLLLSIPAPHAIGLIGGYTFGRTAGLIPMARVSIALLRRRPSSLRQTFRDFWRLPLILAPAAVLNSFGSQMPILIIASLYGASLSGEFGMAERIIFIPLTIFGAAVSQVFRAELAKHVRNNGTNATGIYLRISTLLALPALLLAVLIGLPSPYVIPFLLGEQWTSVGTMCAILSLQATFALVGSPTSAVYTIYQSSATFFLDLLRVILLTTVAFISLFCALTPTMTILYLALAQSIYYVMTWGFGLQLARRGDRQTRGAKEKEANKRSSVLMPEKSKRAEE